MAIYIGDEKWRRVAFVIAEALDDFLFDVETLASLDRDDTVFANFVDNFGDEFADFFRAGGNGGDFGYLLVFTLDFFGLFINTFDDFCASLLDAMSELHRVDAGSNELVGFV